MDEQLKKRLIGAVVLVSLAVIFLPMLLENEPVELEHLRMKPIPEPPAAEMQQAAAESPANSLQQAETPAPAQAQPNEPPKVEPLPVATAPVPPVAEAPKAEPMKPEPTKPEPKKAEEKKPEAKPAPLSSGWIVQVGSYSSKETATQLIEKLGAAGLSTLDLSTVSSNGKTLYRVRIAPEATKEAAQKLQPKVKEISGGEGTVLKFP